MQGSNGPECSIVRRSPPPFSGLGVQGGTDGARIAGPVSAPPAADNGCACFPSEPAYPAASAAGHANNLPRRKRHDLVQPPGTGPAGSSLIVVPTVRDGLSISFSRAGSTSALLPASGVAAGCAGGLASIRSPPARCRVLRMWCKARRRRGWCGRTATAAAAREELAARAAPHAERADHAVARTGREARCKINAGPIARSLPTVAAMKGRRVAPVVGGADAARALSHADVRATFGQAGYGMHAKQFIAKVSSEWGKQDG